MPLQSRLMRFICEAPAIAAGAFGIAVVWQSWHRLEPTLPWWPLGGAFAADQRGGTSKALVFSRFRAAARAIAAVLSYEAERYCFSPQEQRSRGSKPIAYEYRTEKGAKPLVGLRRRPSHTFTFSFGSRTETAMRTFLMFAPLPGLAKLGDPLSMAASSKLLRIDQARKIVENKIIKLLGVSGELRNDDLRVAFNSPFRPFVLATTSIGQEELDFHVWSNHVVHWDLPSNPVDLEQRDGRVNRYGGLAIRRALAENAPCLPSMENPWRALADGQKETMGGLGSWWIHPRASIRRTVFVTPFQRWLAIWKSFEISCPFTVLQWDKPIKKLLFTLFVDEWQRRGKRLEEFSAGLNRLGSIFRLVTVLPGRTLINALPDPRGKNHRHTWSRAPGRQLPFQMRGAGTALPQCDVRFRLGCVPHPSVR